MGDDGSQKNNNKDDSSPVVIETMSVKFLFKGKSVTKSNVSKNISVDELTESVRKEFDLDKNSSSSIKLLYKGKVLGIRNNTNNNNNDNNNNGKRNESTSNRATMTGAVSAFPSGVKGSLLAKVLVMASNREEVEKVQSRRSDPTIRGFENERKIPPTINSSSNNDLFWGSQTAQDKHYKFCKLEACTWQSFGDRATIIISQTTTPHVFEAMSLLERLATDPGIVAVMKERELVVNYLGEMDPIDDRIMQKNEAHGGGCLLGYNTNRGLRIDLKLRSDDLQTFRPYAQLAATLIHELSHNWVSEHDHLFWTNYGQMRVEYLHQHSISTHIVNGKTTAQLAGVTQYCQDGMKSIYSSTMAELRREMMQHGLSPDPIAPVVQARCNELVTLHFKTTQQQKINSNKNRGNTTYGQQQQQQQRTRRELLLEAAEVRARKREDEDEIEKL